MENSLPPGNAKSRLTHISTSGHDPELLDALRAGDEAAFLSLVQEYHSSLLRLAMIYLDTREAAEEIVQDTWIGVLKGLDGFEGRASLKTWIFSILIHRAKTRGRRDSRSVPFSALWDAEGEPFEPAVAPERFRSPEDLYPGGWVSFPRRWDEIPEKRLLSNEVVTQILQTIEQLPPSQREVITLRDLEGWSSDEVCNVLGIGETNQRVLLHRARSKVRRALEAYFDDEGLSRPTQ